MLLDFVETVVASGSGTYPTTVVLLTVLVSLIYWSVRRPNGMPPGPIGLPVIGNMFSKYIAWEGITFMLRYRRSWVSPLLIAHTNRPCPYLKGLWGGGVTALSPLKLSAKLCASAK